MIKILTCHHFRHECAELFYLGVERLKKEYHVQVYAAVTHDDHRSFEIASNNGAVVVATSNKPLGKKWNAVYNLASSLEGLDDVLIVGEDNLISKDVIREYDYIRDICVLGLKRCGIIDTTSGRAKEWVYQDNQRLIGAGRLFAQPPALTLGKPVRPIKVGSHLIDDRREHFMHPNAINDNGRNVVKVRQINALWDDSLNSGLDRSSELTLGFLGYQPKQFDDGRIHVLDFKTASNIHPFSEFKGEEYKGDWKWFLSEAEKEYIHKTWNL